MIRPATPDDLPDLLDMVTALAAHHGDPCRATLDSLTRDLMGGDWARALIAPQGYATLIPRASLQNGTRGMDMHHLFVRPAARGTGLGRALVTACIDHCRTIGCTFLLVGTHPDNTRAQSFYRALGFQPREGRRAEFMLPL